MHFTGKLGTGSHLTIDLLSVGVFLNRLVFTRACFRHGEKIVMPSGVNWTLNLAPQSLPYRVALPSLKVAFRPSEQRRVCTPRASSPLMLVNSQ